MRKKGWMRFDPSFVNVIFVDVLLGNLYVCSVDLLFVCLNNFVNKLFVRCR